MVFPQGLKIELLYYSEIPLLAIYPKEFKPVWFRDSYTLMHVAPISTTLRYGGNLDIHYEMSDPHTVYVVVWKRMAPIGLYV